MIRMFLATIIATCSTLLYACGPCAPKSSYRDSYQRTREAAKFATKASSRLKPWSSGKELKTARICAKSAVRVLPEGSPGDMYRDDLVRLDAMRRHYGFLDWLASNWHERSRDRNESTWRRELDNQWKEVEQIPVTMQGIQGHPDPKDPLWIFEPMYLAMYGVLQLDLDNTQQFNKFYQHARAALKLNAERYSVLLRLLELHASAIQKGLHQLNPQGAEKDCAGILVLPETDDDEGRVNAALSTCDSILSSNPKQRDAWKAKRDASSICQRRTREWRKKKPC